MHWLVIYILYLFYFGLERILAQSDDDSKIRRKKPGKNKAMYVFKEVCAFI